MMSLCLRVAAVAVLLAATASAQTPSLVGCGTRLAEAEFAYGERVYEAVEALALDCAYTVRATPTERTRARRLLALTYLQTDRLADARLMAVRLLSADPEYVADPSRESSAYVALVESIRQQLLADTTAAPSAPTTAPTASTAAPTDPSSVSTLPPAPPAVSALPPARPAVNELPAARPAASALPPARAAGSTPGPPRVDLNTASAEDLDTVPGIGPALAGRILAYREQNGPFRHLDDLQNVRGIGARSMERMTPYITTGGGEVRVVPRPSPAATTNPAATNPTATNPAEAGPRARINVNTASASELEALPRIGPALAQRIIDFRTDYGPFRSVDDLQEVRGIGPRTVEGFADLATVE